MKDLYYLIIRDEHGDDDPTLHGPFKTVKVAQEYAEQEYGPELIFTVIALDEGGTSKYATSFQGITSKFNWV